MKTIVVLIFAAVAAASAQMAMHDAPATDQEKIADALIGRPRRAANTVFSARERVSGLACPVRRRATHMTSRDASTKFSFSG